jgi:hypothetical protein
LSDSTALSYKLVKATSSAAIDTVNEVDAISGADLLMNWTANTITNGVISLTANTTYYFAVLVKDEAGNKAIYAPASRLTYTGVKKIYATTSTYTGATIAGITGADSACSSDAGKPSGGGTYKALLVDGTARVACSVANCGVGNSATDWVMAANTLYVRSDGTTEIAGTSTTTAVFSFNITTAVATSGTAYTGLETNWTTSASTCTAWTVTSGNGAYGTLNQVSTALISSSAAACTGARKLMCVEQ